MLNSPNGWPEQSQNSTGVAERHGEASVSNSGVRVVYNISSVKRLSWKQPSLTELVMRVESNLLLLRASESESYVAFLRKLHHCDSSESSASADVFPTQDDDCLRKSP